MAENDEKTEKVPSHVNDPVGSERGHAWSSTTIIDDVFTDEIARIKPRFEINYEAYLGRLWEANPEIREILRKAESLESARDDLYTYLATAERAVFAVENDVLLVDLPRELSHLEEEKGRHFIDEVHPNPEGHRLIAETIGRVLGRSVLVASEETSRSGESKATKER